MAIAHSFIAVNLSQTRLSNFLLKSLKANLIVVAYLCNYFRIVTIWVNRKYLLAAFSPLSTRIGWAGEGLSCPVSRLDI